MLALVKAMRLPFLTASLFSVFIASVMAYASESEFSIVTCVLSILGTAFFHIFANLINDYIDSKKGSDSANSEFAAPFTGGSRVIQDGLLSEAQVFLASMVFLGLAGLIGLYFLISKGIFVLIFYACALFAGFLYSLVFVGFYIGELIVGLSFGTLVMSGVYYLQTQSVTLQLLLLSIPISLLVALILWINEFPDYKSDQATDKRTLVVRLGRKKAATVYSVLLALCFVFVAVLGFLYTMWGLALAILLIPLALKSISTVAKHYDEPKKMLAAHPLTIAIHSGISCVMLFALSLFHDMHPAFAVFPLVLAVLLVALPSVKLFALQKEG